MSAPTAFGHSPTDGMFLFGVVNASPDSLNLDSIVDGPEAALRRAGDLLRDGANGIDLGGQGSTDAATVVPWQAEWERLELVVPALAELGVPMSVDTWRPEVARRALAAGATVLNAADGMQSDEMWEIAAEHRVPIVVPFLSGPDPRNMTMVGGDPVEALIEFFEQRLAQADRFGMRDLCILDPGTGFAPSNWPWEQRYLYQKQVYSNLGALRRFDLPLYIALPWKDTVQHHELLDIVARQRPEYGRAHYPVTVRAAERAAGVID
jgi:dihydropteroate synthase